MSESVAFEAPVRPDRPSPYHGPLKYGFIDALRGYAVLLVIITHTGNDFPELPYPLKKLTNFGWHGVQLFFLLSCVTLLLSWRSDQAKGIAHVGDFWTRRVVRIAPMYYLAGLLYFVVSPPPPPGLQWPQALTTALFVNSWHPALMPTIPGSWTVVPGSWSVSVEFTFYMVFPLFAAAVGTWQRSMAVLVFSLALGCCANWLAASALLPHVGARSTDIFLYFWFFNQFPVFAMGALLYHLLLASWAAPDLPVLRFLRRHGTWVALACVAACVGLTNLDLPSRLAFAPPFMVPRLYLAAAVFSVFSLALSCCERSLFNNAWIRSLGRASFSAYLLHPGVLIGLLWLAPSLFGAQSTGFRAIGGYIALLVCTAAITYPLSLLTFQVVERPIIALGRSWINRRRAGSSRGERLDPAR